MCTVLQLGCSRLLVLEGLTVMMAASVLALCSKKSVQLAHEEGLAVFQQQQLIASHIYVTVAIWGGLMHLPDDFWDAACLAMYPQQEHF